MTSKNLVSIGKLIVPYVPIETHYLNYWYTSITDYHWHPWALKSTFAGNGWDASTTKMYHKTNTQANHWRDPRSAKKVSRVLITPMGTPTWLWSANDHGVAHVQGNTVPWALPCAPYWQLTMTLYIYRPRLFQCTWFGVNPPGGCWVPVTPGRPYEAHGHAHTWWANYKDVAHPQANAILMNLIWSEFARWLLSSSALNFQRVFITPAARPCNPDGQMTMALHMYKPRLE